MVTPVVCLNLFFIPAVSLWYYYNLDDESDIKPSLKLLLQYAIFAVCNVPLTKVGVVLVKLLLHKEIFIDSGYYTLLATIFAYMLSYLFKKAGEIRQENQRQLNKVQ